MMINVMLDGFQFDVIQGVFSLMPGRFRFTDYFHLEFSYICWIVECPESQIVAFWDFPNTVEMVEQICK